MSFVGESKGGVKEKEGREQLLQEKAMVTNPLHCAENSEPRGDF